MWKSPSKVAPFKSSSTSARHCFPATHTRPHTRSPFLSRLFTLLSIHNYCTFVIQLQSPVTSQPSRLSTLCREVLGRRTRRISAVSACTCICTCLFSCAIASLGPNHRKILSRPPQTTTKLGRHCRCPRLFHGLFLGLSSHTTARVSRLDSSCQIFSNPYARETDLRRRPTPHVQRLSIEQHITAFAKKKKKEKKGKKEEFEEFAVHQPRVLIQASLSSGYRTFHHKVAFVLVEP